MNELVIFTLIVTLFTAVSAMLWIVKTIWTEMERRRTEPFKRLH